MSPLMQYLSEFNVVTIVLRMLLAMAIGGALGLEREIKKRPAGFRTHMLVCLGSAVVMLTSQFIMVRFGGSDIMRMGAQVVSGIGFLGAGTIIVTGRNQVRGLTTAASLWAVACIGLAVGIGFYELAVIGCVLILVSLTLLRKFDEFINRESRVIELYAELQDQSALGALFSAARANGLKITDLDISKGTLAGSTAVSVIFTVSSGTRRPHSEIITLLGGCEGIMRIEKLA